ncbi:MAG: MATE family efflux transporter [Lachnospiraceae bacterium]|nr:MATE family efflux transporter [Lachnospiraceae bacterium]
MKQSKYEIDMCQGPLLKKMILFALPLMATGMLQILFNAVDIIVVGRFTGSSAMAAVGATTALVNIFVSFIIGVSMGANVLAGQSYASGNHKRLHDVVHTAISLAIVMGILMIFAGSVLARGALLLMGTPSDIIDQSVLYLRIYFLAMPFLMLNNFGGAILRAIGDTRRPLIYLTISGICNIILNLILVVIFHLGVIGVAAGTFLSMFISSLLIVLTLMRAEGTYRLNLRELQLNRRICMNLIQIGIPAGLQSSLINVSNALIQSGVNSFGTLTVAANTAANNLFSFMFYTINSVSQTGLSFSSQNYGAGKLRRVDQVLHRCICIEIVMGTFVGLFVFLLRPVLLGIYSSDPEVITQGSVILSISCLTYGICGLMDMLPCVIRGMGYSLPPMLISVVGVVGMRFLWILGYFPTHHTLYTLYLSYPLSWSVTALFQMLCYRVVRKKVEQRYWSMKNAG